jgi:hypothetical protein
MNWSAIGAVGEAFGAIAVLVSLIYLATQIRQNTRMMKSTVRQQITSDSQELLFKLAEHADVAAKAAVGEDLTPAESFQARVVLRAMFRGWENYAYQHQHGLLDPSEWRGIRETMRRLMLTSQLARDEWLSTRDEYSDALQTTLDAFASDEPPSAD